MVRNMCVYVFVHVHIGYIRYQLLIREPMLLGLFSCPNTVGRNAREMQNVSSSHHTQKVVVPQSHRRQQP